MLRDLISKRLDELQYKLLQRKGVSCVYPLAVAKHRPPGEPAFPELLSRCQSTSK